MPVAADSGASVDDRRLRVFVSSSPSELAEERDAASAAVRTLRLTPVTQELAARAEPVSRSDVFVGIYWQRYGWRPDASAASAVEDEYLGCGEVPRLVYVKRGVVERADEAAVEVDVAVRDGVGDADAGQPRRRRRVDEEADEGDSARDQERRANERERGRATLMEPEQHAGGDGEVQRQVGEAEQAGETRERVRGVLHVSFDEEVRRPLERDELAGVTRGVQKLSHPLDRLLR